MPDRMIRSDFGETAEEMGLSLTAFLAYPFIQRAFDNFGCARDKRIVIKAKAFLIRSRPTLAEVDKYIEEYLAAGLVEITDGWIYITRWFKDNRFYGKLRPVAPMPKYMEEYMEAAQWESANRAAFENTAAALGARREAGGKVPDSPGLSRTVPPNRKKPNQTKSKLTKKKTWPHQKDFAAQFKSCWKATPSENQDLRGKEYFEKHGWAKLKAAMLRVGGDYGFRSVGNVLNGEWDHSRGGKDKPGRQHVDEE